MQPRRRGAVNDIVPGLVYQRGQVLTWSREKKYRLLADNGIRWVVNFWTKIDADLADYPLHGYVYVPTPDSARIRDGHVVRLADHLANEVMVRRSPVLVLCEAGRTRSVFFCVLLARRILGMTGPEALSYVQERVTSTELKPGMVAYLNGLKRAGGDS